MCVSGWTATRPAHAPPTELASAMEASQARHVPSLRTRSVPTAVVASPSWFLLKLAQLSAGGRLCPDRRHLFHRHRGDSTTGVLFLHLSPSHRMTAVSCPLRSSALQLPRIPRRAAISVTRSTARPSHPTPPALTSPLTPLTRRATSSTHRPPVRGLSCLLCTAPTATTSLNIVLYNIFVNRVCCVCVCVSS